MSVYACLRYIYIFAYMKKYSVCVCLSMSLNTNMCMCMHHAYPELSCSSLIYTHKIPRRVYSL